MTGKKGFTLIEVLVVMVIIAIATSVIVLSVGNFYLSSKRSDTFAHELATRIQLAQDQAIFSLTTLGLQIASGTYTFMILDDHNQQLQWKPLANSDDFWKSQNIPGSMILTLNIEGNQQSNLFPQSATSPQIIIYPSGELTPFTITIHKEGSDELYTIKGTYAGNLRVSTS